MGTQLTATCTCGVNEKVYIGSGRASHGEVFQFPYFCDDCCSIESIDVLENTLNCNKCVSSSIHSYASNTKTLSFNSFNFLNTKILKFIGFHKRDDVVEESYCYVLKKYFVITKDKHYCPKCNEKNLTFHISALFD